LPGRKTMKNDLEELMEIYRLSKKGSINHHLTFSDDHRAVAETCDQERSNGKKGSSMYRSIAVDKGIISLPIITWRLWRDGDNGRYYPDEYYYVYAFDWEYCEKYKLFLRTYAGIERIFDIDFKKAKSELTSERRFQS
jgi:hypothetical protein